MNILDAMARKGIDPKKVSAGTSGRGAEYHSACPRCGGVDRPGDPSNRFHVWPEQGDGGTWWCRQCNEGGDLIKFMMTFDGMGFKDACRAVGREVPEWVRKPFQQPAGERAATWRPAAAGFANDVDVVLWRAHAGKFVGWCHEQLLKAPDQLVYLRGRGINLDTVKRCGLGYNPGENGNNAIFRDRSAWGLPVVKKSDGRRKMLWLPRGIVIPYAVAGDLVRVRIRRDPRDIRPDFDLKYYVVPGSASAPMLLGRDRTAFVVVEAELDAIAVYQAAGDMAGALAVLTSHGKPDPAADEALRRANCILNALDADEAGTKGSAFWADTYPRTKRWPVPEGKDPGDAATAGVDLRAWVLAGLPPVYRVAPSVAARAADPSAETAETVVKNPEKPGQNPEKPGQNPTEPAGKASKPAGVEALYRLLAKYPVKIIARWNRTAIVPHPSWQNWDVIGEISKLVYFDPAVLDFVTDHPAEVVHRGNFWMEGRP